MKNPNTHKEKIGGKPQTNLVIEGKRFKIDLQQIKSTITINSCIKKDGKGCTHNKIIKTVSFAEKLVVNENSLDSSMIERMNHNLEYNDDRIFENLSIFKQKSFEEQDPKNILKQIKKVEEDKEPELSQDKLVNGDSGNKDLTSIDQNQGILSVCEESGGILDSKNDEQRKDPIFESQVSVIERNEEGKETFDLANDLEDLEFDKSWNQENSSGFFKLNDSLIKSREVWKDKNIKRESFKKILNISKNKMSDSSLLKTVEEHINNSNILKDSLRMEDK